MYLNSINIKNMGPIAKLTIKLKAPEGRAPLPLVFVGANGSGKSLVLAQIASALINAQGSAFEDSDVPGERVFKMRSNSYIRHGENYSFSDLQFSDGFFEHEIVLDRSKEDFENKLLSCPLVEGWKHLDPDNRSKVINNFYSSQSKTRQVLAGPHIYFPANRFEDPAWINNNNLRNKIDYSNIRRIEGNSDLKVIEYAPMKDNQSWLLNRIFDTFAGEGKAFIERGERSHNAELATIRYHGPATILLRKISVFISEFFGQASAETDELAH